PGHPLGHASPAAAHRSPHRPARRLDKPKTIAVNHESRSIATAAFVGLSRGASGADTSRGASPVSHFIRPHPLVKTPLSALTRSSHSSLPRFLSNQSDRGRWRQSDRSRSTLARYLPPRSTCSMRALIVANGDPPSAELLNTL